MSVWNFTHLYFSFFFWRRRKKNLFSIEKKQVRNRKTKTRHITDATFEEILHENLISILLSHVRSYTHEKFNMYREWKKGITRRAVSLLHLLNWNNDRTISIHKLMFSVFLRDLCCLLKEKCLHKERWTTIQYKTRTKQRKKSSWIFIDRNLIHRSRRKCVVQSLPATVFCW